MCRRRNRTERYTHAFTEHVIYHLGWSCALLEFGGNVNIFQLNIESPWLKISLRKASAGRHDFLANISKLTICIRGGASEKRPIGSSDAASMEPKPHAGLGGNWPYSAMKVDAITPAPASPVCRGSNWPLKGKEPPAPAFAQLDIACRRSLGIQPFCRPS